MKLKLLVSSLLLFVQPVFAADTKPNDQALVSFLKDYIYELQQPVYVYNWFPSYGHDPVWQSALKSDSSAAYDHYKSMSPKYYNSFCAQDATINPPDCPKDAYAQSKQFGSGNMFGPGLYAALDPVTTSTYGGDTQNWVLLQMHLPKGTRLFDLRRDGQMTFPLRVQRVLQNYGCPTAWSDLQNGMNMMFSANNTYLTGQAQYSSSGSSGNGSQIADTCLLELRKVLKDDLKPDAVFYSYSSTNFKECDLPTTDASNTNDGAQGNNPFRQGAFVITSDKILQPADIRVFNSKTADDIEDRTRIMSLFYKADVDSPSSAANSYFQGMQFPGYPNYNFSGVTSNCSYANGQQTCKKQIYVCPTASGSCVMIDPPSWPPAVTLPDKISAANVPGSIQLSASGAWNGTTYTPGKKTLLWADLDGQAITPDLGTFIKTNFFGCQATREYDAIDDE